MSDGVQGLKTVGEAAVSEALNRVVPAEFAGADPVVRRSERADFQANAALALAKRVGSSPRDLAGRVLASLDASGLVAAAEVSGPGFVNLTLTDAAIWRQVTARLDDARLGVGSPETGRRTVIDYSAPNIAKEMHVGHLRTTIIGDALARVLDFLGADVVRQNHLGIGAPSSACSSSTWTSTRGPLARAGTHRSGRHRVHVRLGRPVPRRTPQFDADPEFVERARARVVALQAGDEATLATWRELVAESQQAFQAIYGRLGVLLTPEDAAGSPPTTLPGRGRRGTARHGGRGGERWGRMRVLRRRHRPGRQPGAADRS